MESTAKPKHQLEMLLLVSVDEGVEFVAVVFAAADSCQLLLLPLFLKQAARRRWR